MDYSGEYRSRSDDRGQRNGNNARQDYRGQRDQNYDRNGGYGQRHDSRGNVDDRYRRNNQFGGVDYRDRDRDRTRVRYRERERERDPRDNYNGYNNQSRGYNNARYDTRDRYQQNQQFHPTNQAQSMHQQGSLAKREEPFDANGVTQQAPQADLEEEELPELPKISKSDQIKKYLKRLYQLKRVQSIDEVQIIDSQWGIKPKGFDNVTVQRAKLSGLFPLPGYPRPVDFTKIEDSLSNGKSNLLQDTNRIDPLDSRNAKMVVVSGIDFGKIDYMKVADYLDKFLAKIDIAETSLSNIESKRKTKDDKNLIIQFKNNVCATIVVALNEHTIPVSQLKYTEEKDEEEREDVKVDMEDPIEEDEGVIELKIERPGEYVTQCLPPYKTINTTDIEESVIDNPRKCTLLINPTTTETELLNILKSKDLYIKSFQLLREIGTKESTGIAFFEYYFDPTSYKNTIKVIPAIANILNELKNENPDVIYNSFLSCVIPGKTGIEDCPMDFSSLKSLAKGEYVTNHPKLKVIELINLVTAKDLIDDSNYKFIYNDILQECKTFGQVKSIKIPRPANDYTPGISQFLQPGLGKVYVEFEEEQLALDAIMGLAGRMYNDRTVLCAFHNHQDYLNGIL